MSDSPPDGQAPPPPPGGPAFVVEPSASAPVSLAAPQRQSLWAIAFLAFRTVRQVGLVQIALIIGFAVARLPSLIAVMGLVVAIGLVLFVIAALQWWRYTFRLVDDELVVERGVLQRQTLSVPLSRVQSVSLEQKLLHRIVSLVQISLDTAGTDTAEFVIDAVDKSVAQELQRVVGDFRASGSETGPNPAVDGAPAPPETVVVSHDAGRIVRVALTQTPFAGLVLVAPLFATANELSEYIPFELPELGERDGRWWLLWLIPMVLLGGFLLSVVLNLVRVLMTEWNLTLRSTEAGLRRDAGLLSTTSVAAPLPRVQMIGIRQGVLERLVSLRTVRLETIGSTNLVVPGCTADQSDAVRRLALIDSPGVQVLDQRVSPKQVLRDTRNTAIAAGLITLVLGFFIGWWALPVLAFVPIVWAMTRREVRLRRWGRTTEALADRREIVGWRRQELLTRKVNAVTLTQGLFERKRGLATVTASTAAGSLSIGMIPLKQAQRLRDEILVSTETDRRAWM